LKNSLIFLKLWKKKKKKKQVVFLFMILEG
jgi:hypothetical protein